MEKKEIGKLLELLNEYSKEIGYFNADDLQGQTKAWILSKEFGWIERLVEQDKIRDDGIKPRTDLVKEITIVDYDTGKAIGWKNKYSETEQLLMYLAISEQPIELLISILK